MKAVDDLPENSIQQTSRGFQHSTYYTRRSPQAKRLIESRVVLPYQSHILDNTRVVHYKKGR